MHYLIKIIILFELILLSIPPANAQVGKENLSPLLSTSDQKKITKIDATFDKGRAVEEEAQALKTNEKKYNLKRLQASQYYQTSNNDMINLMKDNIERFWKNNKSTSVQSTVKNNEDKANELARKARSLRYVAEDLVYPAEKLVKIIEAEEVEKEAIGIYIKVLYSYLNYPIDYNVVSSNQNISDKQENPPIQEALAEKPVKKKQEKAEPIIEYIPETPKKDTAIAPKTESTAKKDTSSLYNIIEVNEDQIDKFNKFLEDSFPNKYENYVINFNKLDYSDVESLKKAWHNYIFTEHPYDEGLTEFALKDSSENIDIAAVDNNTSKIGNDRTSKAQEKSIGNKKSTESQKTGALTDKSANLAVENQKSGKQSIKTENNNSLNIDNTANYQSVKKRDPKNQNTTSEKVNPENDSQPNKSVTGTNLNSDNKSFSNTKGFVYRVQISACRIPIDAKSLESIYNGEQKAQELFEDNWYKYVIGEYTSYSEARTIKEQIKVPGAFVIAYLNGKRIKTLKPGSDIAPTHDGINFKVQLAASKKPLDQKYLRNIYSGNQQIEEQLEDDWYKYSISFGPNLTSALKFIESQDIPGAFITSYMGNNKIELKEALKINKSK